MSAVQHDFFLSHASQDKEAVALPLAEELRRRGYTVWLDKFKLTVGDSLRSKIDEGLCESRFGVVVLSAAFFSKNWPVAELNALHARAISSGNKVILPVWHRITYSEVQRYSALIADLLATDTSRGITAVANDIEEAYEAATSISAAASSSGQKTRDSAHGLPSTRIDNAATTPIPPTAILAETAAVPPTKQTESHYLRRMIVIVGLIIVVALIGHPELRAGAVRLAESVLAKWSAYWTPASLRGGDRPSEQLPQTPGERAQTNAGTPAAAAAPTSVAQRTPPTQQLPDTSLSAPPSPSASMSHTYSASSSVFPEVAPAKSAAPSAERSLAPLSGLSPAVQQAMTRANVLVFNAADRTDGQKVVSRLVKKCFPEAQVYSQATWVNSWPMVISRIYYQPPSWKGAAEALERWLPGRQEIVDYLAQKNSPSHFVPDKGPGGTLTHMVGFEEERNLVILVGQEIRALELFLEAAAARRSLNAEELEELEEVLRRQEAAWRNALDAADPPPAQPETPLEPEIRRAIPYMPDEEG